MNQESKVIACIDVNDGGVSATDHAAWAAQRLSLELELLHIIERHPSLTEEQDHSGTLELNAQESLMEKFTSAEEARSRTERELARQLLSELRHRALAFEPPAVDVRLRHGDLEETIESHAAHVNLLVIGRNSQAEQTGRIGQHVEWLVRLAKRPTLVVGPKFQPPERVVLAFDGSSAMRQKVLNWVADPLLRGVHVHVIVVGKDVAKAQSVCTWATSSLQSQQVAVTSEVATTTPVQAILQSVGDHDANWVVMGAYSHAWWKRWFVQSNTDLLLKALGVTAYLIPA